MLTFCCGTTCAASESLHIQVVKACFRLKLRWIIPGNTWGYKPNLPISNHLSDAEAESNAPKWWPETHLFTCIHYRSICYCHYQGVGINFSVTRKMEIMLLATDWMPGAEWEIKCVSVCARTPARTGRGQIIINFHLFFLTWTENKSYWENCSDLNWFIFLDTTISYIQKYNAWRLCYTVVVVVVFLSINHSCDAQWECAAVRFLPSACILLVQNILQL